MVLSLHVAKWEQPYTPSQVSSSTPHTTPTMWVVVLVNFLNGPDGPGLR